MSEENEKVKGEEQAEGQREQQTEDRQDTVTLTAEQYERLLDRIAELEEVALKGRSVFTVDDLAYEGVGRPKSGFQTEESAGPVKDTGVPDVESMTQTELVNYIISEVNKAARPIVEELELLKVLREIDKCEAKYSDFNEYAEEVQRIVMNNPSLSIEQAYKLAKAERGEGKAEKGVRQDRDRLIYDLPPRPRRQPAGERPSTVSAEATQEKGPATTKEAAARAWQEVFKEEV